MFSSAVRVGTRLNDWNTKPTRSRRSNVSCLSVSVGEVGSPMNTAPDVSESSPARQCSSVDFPEPDGPMIAVQRPASNERDPVERPDLGGSAAVDLDGIHGPSREADRRRDRRGGDRRRHRGLPRFSDPATNERAAGRSPAAGAKVPNHTVALPVGPVVGHPSGP